MMANSSSNPAAEGESTQVPNWLDLPLELTTMILHKLDAFEILAHACLVCSLWWKICKDPLMFRTLELTKHFSSYLHVLTNLCRIAIKRSCNQLEEISVAYSAGNDEVLKYIANSASHLKRMRLWKCWGITNKGLSEVATKFPLLEELEISMLYLSAGTLELIGQSCPFLKVLKLQLFSKFFKGFECNFHAFAIARTMPELRHLQLFRNELSNVDLLAILDGCPHLESLDLRACYSVDLSGSLGERCRKQIKDLYVSENLSLLLSFGGDEDDDFEYDDCFFDPVCEFGCEWDKEEMGTS